MYCDWGHNTNEARVLQTGGGSNIFLCREHYEYEMKWRRERNRGLEDFAQFSLPEWEELPICDIY